MKIAFFSNFLNHHQLPMCEAFLAHPNVEFKFVACEQTEEERLNMGYADMNRQYSFVVRAYEDESEAMNIATTYDVVIFGASPLAYLEARMNRGLLSFCFSERSFKKGTWRRFIPQTRKKIYDGYTKYKKAPLYVLCASAYTSYDLSLCGFDAGKCFKWGYFPKAEEIDNESVFAEKSQNTVPEILYAGRLLKLKHVIDTVKAVNTLVKAGEQMHFTIIGDGEAKSEIEDYIAKNSLEQYVTILPFMKPEEVREYMRRADIYVFGSDFREGWGAVVNEAMNSSCALLVSHAVGSAKYLVNDGTNGFIYEYGNQKDLETKLGSLVRDSNLRKCLGSAAYNTVVSEWTADLAVKRFVELCGKMQTSSALPEFSDGPCSPAGIVKNNWIKNKRI